MTERRGHLARWGVGAGVGVALVLVGSLRLAIRTGELAWPPALMLVACMAGGGAGGVVHAYLFLSAQDKGALAFYARWALVGLVAGTIFGIIAAAPELYLAELGLFMFLGFGTGIGLAYTSRLVIGPNREE